MQHSLPHSVVLQKSAKLQFVKALVHQITLIPNSLLIESSLFFRIHDSSKICYLSVEWLESITVIQGRRR